MGVKASFTLTGLHNWTLTTISSDGVQFGTGTDVAVSEVDGESAHRWLERICSLLLFNSCRLLVCLLLSRLGVRLLDHIPPLTLFGIDSGVTWTSHLFIELVDGLKHLPNPIRQLRALVVGLAASKGFLQNSLL